MAGGNFGPNTGGGRTETSLCEDLVITTNITTPEENLFNSLELEDELDVRLTDVNKSIGLFNKDGVLIGSIIDPNALKLIKCLKEGKKFIAIIKEKKEAYIEVFIFNVKKSD
ncbi:MAG: hypothetical protein WCY75_01980 [Sulfurimonadaceae bacterium]